MKAPAARRFVEITDRLIEAWRQFQEDEAAPVYFYDAKVRGLRIRLGKSRYSWSFYRQYQEKGTRGTLFRKLGDWPAMGVKEARAAALVIAAQRTAPGEKTTFAEAFTAYLSYLEQHKAVRTRRQVENIGKSLLLPRWGKWPLADLSRRPDLVAGWHSETSRRNGPVAANRAAQTLRAVYRRAAKLNRGLPAELPTSGVTFNQELRAGSGHALAFKDFPAWDRARRKLPPVHAAFHLTNLLTGCRPGELARLRWEDVGTDAFVIPQAKTEAKTGREYRVVLSAAISEALESAGTRGVSDVVFIGCKQAANKDALSATGTALRRTYRTIAADVGVDELLAHYLLNHAPAGISQRYISTLILASGAALKDAQAKISRRIVELLGIAL